MSVLSAPQAAQAIPQGYEVTYCINGTAGFALVKHPDDLGCSAPYAAVSQTQWDAWLPTAPLRTTGPYCFAPAGWDSARPHEYARHVLYTTTCASGTLVWTKSQFDSYASLATVPPGAPDSSPELPAAAECPAMPATYGGANETVAELRNERREAVQTCEVLRSRLSRLEALGVSEDGNTGDVESLLRRPLEVRLTTDGNQVEVVQRADDPGVLVRHADSPLPVDDVGDDENGGPASTVALSDVDRTAMRKDAASMTWVMWFLAGLLLACTCGPLIVRTFYRP